MKWSPDGTRASYLQREDSGERAALYSIDFATGKSAVLVSGEKLASLAPPASSIKDERQKEAMQRYSVAAYHWSPDSAHLLFDSLGQLWCYTIANGNSSSADVERRRSGRSQIFANGDRLAFVRKHDLYVHDTKNGHEVGSYRRRE